MSDVTQDLGGASQPVCYCPPLRENSHCWKSRIKPVQNKTLTKDLVDHYTIDHDNLPKKHTLTVIGQKLKHTVLCAEKLMKPQLRHVPP